VADVKSNFPAGIDLLICGGGTAGAALAGIIARDTDLNVVVLEAGPDYGARLSGRWPAELLDARCIPDTHQWGYSGSSHRAHLHETAFERAKVIGGCSAHNGCVALLGHRLDYDAWAKLGNTGWDWESVAPAFARARAGLRVRAVLDHEVTPYHAAFIDGAVAAGIPRSPDMNDPDEKTGVAASPVNIHDGIRWNTALGYLDPVRERPNLTIIGDALVDRVEVRGGRAVAVHALINGQPERIEAQRIVISGGAYGSPAILLRSGVGPGRELHELGIAVTHDLPGVGKALADHPAVNLRYQASATLNDAMEQFRAGNWTPDEQSLAKVRSRRCQEAFDLHLYAVAGWRMDDGTLEYAVAVSSVYPRSLGQLTLRSQDPTAPPRIEHNYLSDPDDEDITVLLDGVELTREIMAKPIRDGLLAEETWPGNDLRTREQLRDWIERTVGIYYHPACSCRMGPASDPLAVVDPTGKVHGLDNLYVCDASIFPTLMRANTNLPTVMLAEHLARTIGQ
jgi:choline dehydrogenase